MRYRDDPCETNLSTSTSVRPVQVSCLLRPSLQTNVLDNGKRKPRLSFRHEQIVTTHDKPQESHAAPYPIGLRTFPPPLARPIVIGQQSFTMGWLGSPPFNHVVFASDLFKPSERDLSSEYRYPDHSRLDLTETAGPCFLLLETKEGIIQHEMC